MSVYVRRARDLFGPLYRTDVESEPVRTLANGPWRLWAVLSSMTFVGRCSVEITTGRLAHLCNASDRSTVRRWARTLETVGLLRREEHRDDDGHSSANSWVLLTPRPAAKPAAPAAPAPPKPPDAPRPSPKGRRLKRQERKALEAKRDALRQEVEGWQVIWAQSQQRWDDRDKLRAQALALPDGHPGRAHLLDSVPTEAPTRPAELDRLHALLLEAEKALT